MSNLTIKEKRENLKAISKVAQTAIKNGDTDAEKVNEYVVQHYKSENPEIKEFKTFHQWKADGFNIIKGSKAFVVWGSPRKGKIENPVKNENGENEDEFEFFPLCYLFANTQVERRAK